MTPDDVVPHCFNDWLDDVDALHEARRHAYRTLYANDPEEVVDAPVRDVHEPT